VAKVTRTEQWVLLPPVGLRARGRGNTADATAFFRSAAAGASSAEVDGRQLPLKVIDSIGEDGAKLVELSPDARLSIRSMLPSVRLVPVVYYEPALAPHVHVRTRAIRTGTTAPTVTLRIVSKADGKPVAGAIVVALVDVDNRIGAQGTTDRQGRVRLSLGSASVKLEALYVYPRDTYWSLRRPNVTISSPTEVPLLPLDLGVPDGLRHLYGTPDLTAGRGVTVGVVDTGIAEHPDLVIHGGANTVTGEDPQDHGDNGRSHGTHVAGIIAARGQAPTGVRGVAPGVRLRSYRVFARNSGSASSFAIAKAIDQAVADRCDLLNMSLGGGPADPVLAAAIDEARLAGTLCIIAAGNGGREPVSFPALVGSALAVSAMGRKGTFPSSATEVEDIARPYGTDKKDFVAGFSNIGPEIDLTGPGVAIISTVPTGHTGISGTSMACPAVTGAAARVVVASGLIRKKRDAARTDAMIKAVLSRARSLGFGPVYEGHGLPRPEQVG
jgi:subtilisin